LPCEQENTVNEAPADFAQQLRSLREARGLSIRALAALVGVSKVTIWKWEKGDSVPRTRSLLPLAKALQVTPYELGASVPLTLRLPDQIEPEAQDQAEALADVIARAKRMIAEASGTTPQNITISIEY
jgi:transcriptional regulator with XRE-family HTH domain